MASISPKERLRAFLMSRSLPDVEPGGRRVSVSPLDVAMSDGVVLKADLLMPESVEPGAPTVVIRTPYGRGTVFMVRMALPLATYGFPVLLQSVRGTFGSGGVLRPQIDEARDGADTLRWVRQQPWFTGRLATAGESYLGYTQWAAAAHLMGEDPSLASEAMSLSVTSSDFGAMTWDNGAFQLLSSLGWTRLMNSIEKPTAMLTAMLPDRRLARAVEVMPMSEADTTAVGRSVDWYREWVSHEDLRDEYWTRQSHAEDVAGITAPILMVTGWHDHFLPWQMTDYEALVAAGRPPLLTVGPWAHSTDEGVARNVSETIDFFRLTFLGVETSREAPVLFHLGGADEWVAAESWPPRPPQNLSLHLAGGGALGTGSPTGPTVPTRYSFDPKTPTPSTGVPPLQGAVIPCDDAAHESRSDVVTFTSEELLEDIDIAGTPSATIWLRSDRPSVDLFVRLTDVHPDDRSMAVCDGIRRIGGAATAHLDPEPDADGVRRISLSLRPTAHRFLVGHRVRVQISSGAFPRYARNNGSGRPAADDVELFVSNQEIFHEPGRESSITLPQWIHS